ncbi:MAG: cold shock domain-containing protein [Pseudomonadota bacterium]
MNPITLLVAGLLGLLGAFLSSQLPSAPLLHFVLNAVIIVSAILLTLLVQHQLSQPRTSGPRVRPMASAAPVPTPVATASAIGGPTESGVVKWFNVKKGFGFIVRENGEELFVHYRSIQLPPGRQYLQEGQLVEYVIGSGRKGPQAENVIPI